MLLSPNLEPFFLLLAKLGHYVGKHVGNYVGKHLVHLHVGHRNEVSGTLTEWKSKSITYGLKTFCFSNPDSFEF